MGLFIAFYEFLKALLIVMSETDQYLRKLPPPPPKKKKKTLP